MWPGDAGCGVVRGRLAGGVGGGGEGEVRGTFMQACRKHFHLLKLGFLLKYLYTKWIILHVFLISI